MYTSLNLYGKHMRVVPRNLFRMAESIYTSFDAVKPAFPFSYKFTYTCMDTYISCVLSRISPRRSEKTGYSNDCLPDLWSEKLPYIFFRVPDGIVLGSPGKPPSVSNTTVRRDRNELAMRIVWRQMQTVKGNFGARDTGITHNISSPWPARFPVSSKKQIEFLPRAAIDLSEFREVDALSRLIYNVSYFFFLIAHWTSRWIKSTIP